MSDPAKKRLTASEFIAWAMERPEHEHYELVGGEIVAMTPERIGHARMKFRVARRLAEAIEGAGLDCEVFVDGVSLRVSDATVYEPDVMLRCGPRLESEITAITDPLAIVEVLSPSTQGTDTGVKFTDYFAIPSVQHYLLINPETPVIVHHRREAGDAIATQIIRNGGLRLDPPGIEIAGLFPNPGN